MTLAKTASLSSSGLSALRHADFRVAINTSAPTSAVALALVQYPASATNVPAPPRWPASARLSVTAVAIGTKWGWSLVVAATSAASTMCLVVAAAWAL
ncbi:MAG: hypothetical protein WA944_02035 [Mycobacterium sp.]